MCQALKGKINRLIALIQQMLSSQDRAPALRIFVRPRSDFYASGSINKPTVGWVSLAIRSCVVQASPTPYAGPAQQGKFT